jgi:methionyl-tRNA formyltransferase
MVLNNKIKVYFLGSGKIGIPALNAVNINENFELVGIGTQEDRTGGRKNKIISTPVAVWADENNLKVDKIKSVNGEEFLLYLENMNIDILLVASFGQILKPKLLSMPAVDCVNIHASLLPKYRGASPLTAAILNGDEKTGVAFMRMEKGLDTGPVYSMHEYKMDFTEDSDKLEDVLAAIAGNASAEVLIQIVLGELKPIIQNHEEATHVWKIKKQDGLINWNQSAGQIERMIRAYMPWPGAFFFLKTGRKQKKIQITSAKVVSKHDEKAGTVLKSDKKEWIIACGENAIEIVSLIPEGKNEMSGVEFLRGCRVEEGTCLININN